MKKSKVVILGITGSIGDSSCEVIRKHRDRFEIVFASGHNNFTKMEAIQAEFAIPTIVMTGKKQTQARNSASYKLYYGEENLLELLKSLDYDIVINAISGSAGLKSSIATLKREKKLALANKESLVMAGHLIEKYTKLNPILPVDSEHSAIFQALGNHSIDEVSELIITASGGSFRDRNLNTFSSITIADTLKHPTWDMGAKVTIDSATMMNKGLEVIEAHWLFNMPFAKIKAIIHPQSIIHSLVRFNDGSLLAQMSSPSMQIPILYALSHPVHIPFSNVQTDLLQIPALTFKEIELKRYPLYFLALEVGEEGGIMPTVMNSVNEACISLFLNNKIKFTDFYTIISETLLAAKQIVEPDLETIIEVNGLIYDKTIKEHSR
ncbi:MAG: 1-deoxy-D-xylulose-5-phosphate reductoisomerase [Candidatus Cloacimonadales bacterium]